MSTDAPRCNYLKEYPNYSVGYGVDLTERRGSMSMSNSDEKYTEESTQRVITHPESESSQEHIRPSHIDQSKPGP